MTLDDYMNEKNFPITTQGDLSPIDQFFIDVVNSDALKRVEAEGRKLNTHQIKIQKELNQKVLAQKALKNEAEKASEGWDYDQ